MRRASLTASVQAGVGAIVCVLILSTVVPGGAPLAQVRSESTAYAGPRCFSTVIPEVTQTLARVAGSRDVGQQIYSTGQTIFLQVEDGQDLEPGQSFRLYRIEGEIKHPRTGAVVGRSINLVATVQVLDSTASRVAARITDACGEVEVGDRLHPILEREDGGGRQLPAFDPDRLIDPDESDATVVYGTSESLLAPGSVTGRDGMNLLESYAAGDVVTIDQGSVDGWTIDMPMVIYMPAEFDSGHAYPKSPEPVIVAQGVVFWLQDSTAAVLLTAGDRAVGIGYRARPQ